MYTIKELQKDELKQVAGSFKWDNTASSWPEYKHQVETSTANNITILAAKCGGPDQSKWNDTCKNELNEILRTQENDTSRKSFYIFWGLHSLGTFAELYLKK